MTVYVSTTDPRESSCVPSEVQLAAVHRLQARSERNYREADALHRRIIDAGYRLVGTQALVLKVSGFGFKIESILIISS